MGFFLLPEIETPRIRGLDVGFLHRHQCEVCPLNNQAGLQHPHMPAHGTQQPLVYMLGEAPGENEDRKGIPFVGKAGRMLHQHIPDEWQPKLRWNNCVRTRPPNNRDPSPAELECCRPSIIKDIEASKPKAIFGFGNVPMTWAFKQANITKWRGRRLPLQVGSHVCWYYPMVHPSFVLHMQDGGSGDWKIDWEFVFDLDLRNAFAEVERGLPVPVIHTPEQALDGVEIITGREPGDLNRIKQELQEIGNEPVVGFDYETNAIRPSRDNRKLLSVAIAGRKRAIGIALSHRQAGWDKKAPVFDLLRNFLYEYKCRKVVHNLAFELEWSAIFFGHEVIRAGRWGCTMAQGFVLNEQSGLLSLNALCLQHFGFDLKAMSRLDRANLDNESLESVLRYNALDAKYHRNLYLAQRDRLHAEGLMDVYQHHLQRIPTFVLTQYKGVPVDQKVVDVFYKKLTTREAKVEAHMAALPIVKRFKKTKGFDFQPSNNNHVGYVVRTMIGAEVRNLEEGSLEKVDHPFCRWQVKWRKNHKQLSTYVIPFKIGEAKSAIWDDGMAHPIISANKVATSRTSSEDMNIQNVPKHKGRELRRQVKPHADYRVVAFDFSGMQARNVAMESKDKALVKAFWENYDIHGDWSRRIPKHYPKWLKEIRAAAKDEKEALATARQNAKSHFVFASFFGAQPHTLASPKHLGIPEHVCAALLEEFWNEFPDIKDWHERIKESYAENGYVTGLTGYRRRAPISPNQLINAPIQADEAKIVCAAMTRLSKRGDDLRYQANMEIHDDLTFIWPRNEIDKNAEVVVREMIKPVYDWINVPLGVEMSVGQDWCDLTKVGTYSSDGSWNGIIELPKELV